MAKENNSQRMPEVLWRQILDGVNCKKIDLAGFVDRFKDLPEPTEADLEFSLPVDFGSKDGIGQVSDCEAHGTQHQVELQLCPAGLAAASIDESEGNGWLYAPATALAITPGLLDDDLPSFAPCQLEVLPLFESGQGLPVRQCSLRLSGIDSSRPPVLIQVDNVEIDAGFDDFGFGSVKDQRAICALLEPASCLSLKFVSRASTYSSLAKIDGVWKDAKNAAKHRSTAIRFLNALLQNSGDLDGLLQCLNVFDIDTLELWLFEPKSYATSAFEFGFHQRLIPILQHVVRRHLLQLRSFGDKDAFVRFWKSLSEALQVRNVVEIVSSYVDELAVGVVQELSNVVEEEERFGSKLQVLAGELAAAADSGVYKSLVSEIANLAKERMRPDLEHNGEVNFKNALVWKAPVLTDTCFSSGIELTIRLCQRSGTDNPLFVASSQLCVSDDFRESFEKVRTQIGTAEWFPLDCREYVGDDLVGSSGTFALFTAQLLAKADGRGMAYTLPPYVDICVACSQDSHWYAAPVGMLSSKLRLLELMGTRVVIVHSSQYREARETLPEAIHVLPFTGSAQELSANLKQLGLVWLCNVKHLQPDDSGTRRAWLIATSAAVAGALSYSYWPSTYQTQAMQKHAGLRQGMLDLWFEIERLTAGRPTSYIELLQSLNMQIDSIGVAKEVVFAECQHRGMEHVTEGDAQWNLMQHSLFGTLSNSMRVPIDAIQIESKPELRFEAMGYAVEYDGKVYDHVGDGRNARWRSLEDVGFGQESLFERPVEPALLTRKVKLTAMDEATRQIRFEFNTSGMGVVPLLNDGDKLSVFVTRMSESQNVLGITYTLVVERTVPERNPGEELEEVACGIYINAFQDQSLRDKPVDWWGTRIQHGTKQADLSIAFPADLHDLKLRRRERPEDGTWIDLDNHPAMPGGEVIDGTRWFANNKLVWFCWHLPLPEDWKKWRQENEDKNAIVYAVLGSWNRTT